MAPVRSYLVAALDPAYGRPLIIATLEPDYNEELQRFVPVEELTSYMLQEAQLEKMPCLFKQAVATVQVAAANDAGQSNWATVRIPMQQGGQAQAAPQQQKQVPAAAAKAPGGKSGGTASEFEAKLRRSFSGAVGGGDLRAWLSKQSKGDLAAWLKSRSMPSAGPKQDLIDRVSFLVASR